MFHVLRTRRAEAAAPQREDREELLASMRATQSALTRAYDGFNRAGAGDSDLIESYVYEINALKSRYSYLLRQMRRLEGAAPRP